MIITGVGIGVLDYVREDCILIKDSADRKGLPFTEEQYQLSTLISLDLIDEYVYWKSRELEVRENE